MSDLKSRESRPRLKQFQKAPSNKGVVQYVYENTGLPRREIQTILRALTDLIKEAMREGENINIWSLGTFRRRWWKGRTWDGKIRKAMKGQTRGPVTSDGHWVVKFDASHILRAHMKTLTIKTDD